MQPPGRHWQASLAAPNTGPFASATRRGVPAPAALERLREYLRHDASEADVAVAFAGGGADKDDSATLADVQEAVTTLELVTESWKRVLGPAHPETLNVQVALASAREALRARETPSGVATRTRAARARLSEGE